MSEVPDEIHKRLEAHGYKKFDSGDYGRLHKLCDVAYQKRFRDAQGTKYFVNLWGYSPKGVVLAWQFCAELTNNKPWFVFEQHAIKFKSDRELRRVERNAQTFWKVLGCEHYEKGACVPCP